MPDLRTNPRGQNANTDGAGRRRGRGDGRIKTHRENAEGLISHAGERGYTLDLLHTPCCKCAVVVGTDLAQ